MPQPGLVTQADRLGDREHAIVEDPGDPQRGILITVPALRRVMLAAAAVTVW